MTNITISRRRRVQYGGPVLVDEEIGEGRKEVQGTNKRKRRKEMILDIEMREHHLTSC